jgi:hypothetical protein
MSTTRKLRLGSLPETESPTDRRVSDKSLGQPRSLAAPHAQTYGEAVDVVTLIPHMLEAFLAGDRGVQAWQGEATIDHLLMRPARRAESLEI